MQELTIDVVWPLGNVAGAGATAERRPGGLADGRLAFAWDYAFKGDQIWAIVKEELARRFPRLGFVEPDAFGNIHDKFGSNDVANQGLKQEIKERDVSAALVGVGA